MELARLWEGVMLVLDLTSLLVELQQSGYFSGRVFVVFLVQTGNNLLGLLS